MSNSKQRKGMLRELSRISSNSPRRYQSQPLGISPRSQKLCPDYGTHYMETFGRKPITVSIANPQIVIGESGNEANISWMANEYMATLIVTPDFAKAYRRNPSQMLRIVPNPDDAYVTSLGETVVPFKLAE